MNLGSKNWVKNEKDYGSDQNEIFEKIITLKNINIGNITKL